LIKSIDTGVLYMLFASFCFAVMLGFAKELSNYMDPLQVVFFRNIIGVAILMLTFFKLPINQIGGRPFLLFFRGLMGFMALVGFFYNVAHIPLADAITFTRTSPIFAAIFAFLLLKEKIGIREVAALVIGFTGIVFIIRPSGIGLELTDILGLVSGIGAALAYTSIKELKKYYDTRVIVLSFMLVGSIGPILIILLNDFIAIEFLKASFTVPDLYMWTLIAGLGLSATVAQVFMTRAYGITKVSIVGAVSYMGILFSLFIGVLMGDAIPDFIGSFGIVLVVIGGILVAKKKYNTLTKTNNFS